ncbi:MAG: hypothetical protein Q7K55_04975 [Candidatus Levybacteria bacterium]|nr:hypothetical protein [Candidatus Levybacteria bacterium]
MEQKNLSRFAEILIKTFEKEETQNNDKKIVVSPVISKVANWYEKFRNAVDYREEEVILRASIERILRRRLLFGGTGRTIAEPLVRELVWAKYFPDESLSESIIDKIESDINLYLKLRELILIKKQLDEKVINEWIYHLMSSAIEHILHTHAKNEIMNNFIFHIMKDNITITDDDKQTNDAQIFIAVRRSFAKDDLAFLRYHLFTQFFGPLNENNLEQTADSFMEGYKEIIRQLNYPRKDKIYNHIRRRTAMFFILEDLLRSFKSDFKELYKNEEEFKSAVFAACNNRYKSISSKVKTAIIRSVIFILLTKVFFAFGVEGAFESAIFGRVIWGSILLNLFIPPILMVIAGFFIKTPGRNNSERVFSYMKLALSEEHPKLGNPLVIKRAREKREIDSIFTFLWFTTFVLAFGAIIFILIKLHFNVISQGVFIVFLALVSFFSYRISQSANIYTIEIKHNITSSITDFLFMPFIRVGRKLSEGISQINLLLFILDFAIETPFKGLFSFFEQWLFFLQSKREELE